MIRGLTVAMLFSMLSVFLGAQQPADGATASAPQFAPPVRLKAHSKWLGENMMYPSPAVYDVNGDGTADIVIGDLPGRVVFAKGQIHEGGILLGEQQPLKGRGGKALKFSNW